MVAPEQPRTPSGAVASACDMCLREVTYAKLAPDLVQDLATLFVRRHEPSLASNARQVDAVRGDLLWKP